jgi:acetyl-CoA carboxylase biotin carboxylase subunit
VFKKILVANRGEVALRIISACRELGIRTVAVYSEADRDALHVRFADEDVCIGPYPSAASYLNISAIVSAAEITEADAIHPGYGFLSENAYFAEILQDCHITFIGPSPEAVRKMGDKSLARRTVAAAGVPTVPGSPGPVETLDEALAFARKAGYPVILKASAGGGGRGMRVARDERELSGAFDTARTEAETAFGSAEVYLEKYLEEPRHIEFQVFGDSRGSLRHMGERECSIQRRHQKLIEESPSAALDEGLRNRMGEAAIAAARSVSYTNAGTVEFLLDATTRQFFFLEVNARLQVEHPVTEFLTGLDLVEQQLRVAAGESLSIGQVRLDGHAIEARVIAEDADFLPSTGRLRVFTPPTSLRVDSGVVQGSEVSAFYDSLLAKVIAHAPSRTEAIRALARGLAEFEIEGVQSNLDLLLATIQSAAFVAGDLHTGVLAEQPAAETPAEVLAAAAVARAPRAWRLGRLDQPVRLEPGGEVCVTQDLRDAHSWHVRVGADEVVAEVLADGSARVNGELARLGAGWVEWRGHLYRVRAAPPLDVEDFAHAASAAGGGGLTAPMPGRVVKVAVAAGDHVSPNQALVVLEAMKMEHVVEAPHAGVVSQVCVEPGQQVSAGELLLDLE